MNIILMFALITGVNLYYVKDSPDLLVRITSETQVENLTLYYSFSRTDWDSVVVERKGRLFETKLKSPDIQLLKVIGLYFTYTNGETDDNNGGLYLYELSIYPRILMPFSLEDFEVMVEQARKKILSHTHISEAVRLLSYMGDMLQVVPYVKDEQSESDRNRLLIEVEDLKSKISR